MTPGRDARRRVLIVAYDFPPHGAIGTMRTLRVVQRLAEDDWDVKVLTSEPRTFRPGTPIDEGLLARVPPSVGVVRAPAFRGVDRLKRLLRGPARSVHRSSGGAEAPSPVARATARTFIGRAADIVDAALAIPDNESGWIAPAVLRGLQVCRGWRPDVLYSSAPPWSGQIVARALATAFRCPWLADFRDPWARAPWRERGEFVKRANALLEQTVVRRADGVVFVTRANLEEFAAFYGSASARRFHLIPNGCDPSEFAAITAAPSSDRFVLLHAGTLYGARNPLPLIHAIARAIARGAIARDRFRLRLVGPINLGVDVPAECRRLGMDDVVEFVPRVSRGDSLREMSAASALLLVQPVTTVSVPGKAYEYLAAGRPLLALAEEGETADLVRESGIGVSIQPEAGVEALEDALLKVIEIASKPYPAPPSMLYDGRVHAATTAALLTQLCGRGGPNRKIVPLTASGQVGMSARVEERRQ